MATLTNDVTLKELADYLLFYIDHADERAAKTNPALTKKDVWDINMGVVMGGNVTRVSSIMVKNLTKEFGAYYE